MDFPKFNITRTNTGQSGDDTHISNHKSDKNQVMTCFTVDFENLICISSIKSWIHVLSVRVFIMLIDKCESCQMAEQLVDEGTALKFGC